MPLAPLVPAPIGRGEPVYSGANPQKPPVKNKYNYKLEDEDEDDENDTNSSGR